MKDKIRKIPLFLLVSLAFAFLYEELPRFMLAHFSWSKHLWELPGWLPVFLLTYVSIFFMSYFIFINKRPLYPAIFGGILGIFLEALLYKKLTGFLAAILFFCLYFGMFYFPFKIMGRLYGDKETKKSELIAIILTQTTAITILVLMSLSG
jgi:uncharacterized membrane protein